MVNYLYYQSKIFYFQTDLKLFFYFYPDIYFVYLIVNYKILYIKFPHYKDIFYNHYNIYQQIF